MLALKQPKTFPPSHISSIYYKFVLKARAMSCRCENPIQYFFYPLSSPVNSWECEESFFFVQFKCNSWNVNDMFAIVMREGTFYRWIDAREGTLLKREFDVKYLPIDSIVNMCKKLITPLEWILNFIKCFMSKIDFKLSTNSRVWKFDFS